MHKKSFLFTLFLLFLFVFSAACQEKPVQPSKISPLTVQELIELEKTLVPETIVIKEKITQAYNDWKEGKIDSATFKSLCGDYIHEINATKGKYKDYLLQHPISKEVENDPMYSQYLFAGKELRSDIGIFLVRVTKGQGKLKKLPTDGNVSKEDVEFIPLSDEEIKLSYKELLENRFNKHLELINTALKQKK